MPESSLKMAQAFKSAKAAVQKSVIIQIAEEDLATLKANDYKLCFAKKVGDADYNVVWQSYNKYLANNQFSWTPQYQLFGSNIFQGNITVQVATNVVQIELGETSVLDEAGTLKPPKTGGSDTGFTMENNYGTIHPGVNQLSTGIDGKQISTPIYVAQKAIVSGSVVLTPVEKVLVWFEQNIQTSTMFSDARAQAVEIDLTTLNCATRMYKDQNWITP
jgi:hypothetical protein